MIYTNLRSRFRELLPRDSSFALSRIQTPRINFVEFIERHGTALDLLRTGIDPRARVPVLINVLIRYPFE